MSILLLEEEIHALIQEPKPFPDGLSPLGRMSVWNKHSRKEVRVSCESGHEFVIHIRQAIMNVMNYSVILGYELPQFHRVFNLRRYNGKHRHTNQFEKESFDCTHMHTATERYQELGPVAREDHFAVPDDRFYSLESAIECLLADCGFRPGFEETPLGRGGMI